eukprot:2107471-Amphidinium_carterae.1
MASCASVHGGKIAHGKLSTGWLQVARDGIHKFKSLAQRGIIAQASMLWTLRKGLERDRIFLWQPVAVWCAANLLHRPDVSPYCKLCGQLHTQPIPHTRGC